MVGIVGVGIAAYLPVSSEGTGALLATIMNCQQALCFALCAHTYTCPSLLDRLGRRSLISCGTFALTPCKRPFVLFLIVTLGLVFLLRRKDPPILELLTERLQVFPPSHCRGVAKTQSGVKLV